MKKLFGFVVLCLVSVVSFAFSAQEWQSNVFSNAVRDIAADSTSIYLATEGGIVVINKVTGTRSYHQHQINGLPGNSVSALAVSDRGIWATGGLGWVSFLPKGQSDWSDFPRGSKDWDSGYVRYRSFEGPLVYDLAAQGGIAWASMVDGLYFDTNGTWQEKTLTHDVQQLAIGKDGELWMINASLITRLEKDSEKVWSVGSELIAGRPFGIAVCNDTVVVPAESGFYLKIGDSSWTVVAWPMMNVGYYITRGIPVPVAIFKGKIYFGAGESIMSRNDPSVWVDPVPGGSLHWTVNCLFSDRDKLYIGTSGGVVTYDGKDFSNEYGNIAKPHNNNITHINADNAGRVLVGSYSGGYRYDVDANSPTLNNSAQNVVDRVVASVVDNKGAQWIGRTGYITRNDIPVYLPNLENGLYPYWMVKGAASSASDIWIVTVNPSSLWSYAGEGTWSNQLNAPAGLAKEKILSVSSTSVRLWIVTDNALYSYNFLGYWTYKKLHYSPVRQVAGDNLANDACWVFDGNYDGGKNSFQYLSLSEIPPTFQRPNWPYINLITNSVCVDSNSVVWVATDSGAYYWDRKTPSWQAVLISKLADKFVNTIYVTNSASEKQIWFGTKGGLTVWHQPNSSTSIVPRPTAVRSSFQVSSPVRSFDLLGRSIAVMPNRMTNTLSGVSIIQSGANKFAKTLTIAR